MKRKHTKAENTKTAKNLTRLADYVEAHVPAKSIQMNHFRTGGTGMSADFISHDDCGTKGCMLGWGPFAPYLKPTEADYRLEALDYDIYGLRLFPALFGWFDHSEQEWVDDESNRDWGRVFAGDLPDDKPFLVAGLRELAAELSAK